MAVQNDGQELVRIIFVSSFSWQVGSASVSMAVTFTFTNSSLLRLLLGSVYYIVTSKIYIYVETLKSQMLSQGL